MNKELMEILLLSLLLRALLSRLITASNELKKLIITGDHVLIRSIERTQRSLPFRGERTMEKEKVQ
jgi:hypothetical protein